MSVCASVSEREKEGLRKNFGRFDWEYWRRRFGKDMNPKLGARFYVAEGIGTTL